jgi:hypothetical protein
MAGNPYLEAGFGQAARDTPPRETFDSMYDDAADTALASARAADYWGHLKTPAPVTKLAGAGAVDYGDMYSTIAHGGDTHDYEIGLARIARNRGQKLAREISAAGKSPDQIALYTMRDGMIPEERSIRPYAQQPRPVGRM